MKAVITVIGEDKVGIVAEISSILAGYNINIVDVNQTIMDGLFTMLMMVDMEERNEAFAVVKERLLDVGKEIGLSIRIQREDIFTSMHEI